MSKSSLGRNLRFTARIIAKSHAIDTQGGTPVPCSDHLVRALLGCQIREIVHNCWIILSDFSDIFNILTKYTMIIYPKIASTYKKDI